MDDNYCAADIFFAIFVTALVGTLACFGTWGNTRRNADAEMAAFRQKAINHQAAHWEVTAQGARSFHWNMPSTETRDE